MASSIKMRAADKERLDRLQGEIMARSGRRVPQEEILSRLLDLGEAQRHRLTEDPERQMNPREIAALKRLAVRTGVRTREEEIDRVLSRAIR